MQILAKGESFRLFRGEIAKKLEEEHKLPLDYLRNHNPQFAFNTLSELLEKITRECEGFDIPIDAIGPATELPASYAVPGAARIPQLSSYHRILVVTLAEENALRNSIRHLFLDGDDMSGYLERIEVVGNQYRSVLSFPSDPRPDLVLAVVDLDNQVFEQVTFGAFVAKQLDDCDFMAVPVLTSVTAGKLAAYIRSFLNQAFPPETEAPSDETNAAVSETEAQIDETEGPNELGIQLLPSDDGSAPMLTDADGNVIAAPPHDSTTDADKEG